MNEILPGLLMTFSLYILAGYLKKRFGIKYLNKFFIAGGIGIAIMLVFRIPYEIYEPGGEFIKFFLSPLVVILAIPVYRNFHVISRYKLIFFIGCFFAVALNIGLLYLTISFFNADSILKTAIYTKSVTGAMAMALNDILEADASLAILMVSFSGITGGITGGLLIKLLKIKSPLAQGIGMGAVSHLIGSMAVLESNGEEANAVASTTLGTVGIMTAIILPLIINYL